MKFVLAALALVVTTLAAPGVASAPAPGDDGPRSVTHRLTLVTGDVVRMHGSRLVDVRPGPGREGVRFTTVWLDDHLHVIPSDAAAALASGRLDERFFDVTRLLAWGYDDDRLSRIPVIAEGAGRSLRGARVTRSFTTSGLTAMGVDKAGASDFWRTHSTARSGGRSGGRLWIDGRVEAALDRSVPRIGAPTAWEKGLRGTGVTVAVLDTGYDRRHPDLAEVVTATKGFSVNGPDDVVDGVGHGTHVASTIAGSGAASDGTYTGVAPGARLAIGKVLDDHGRGQESWVLAGMEWAAETGARVVNLSLGSQDFQGDGPLEQAVDRLTEQTGALFVVSAGNTGEDGPRSIGSPGSATAALTVGAVDGDDRIAEFSSRGPRLGDYAVKPDVTAPGVDIDAAVPVWQDVHYGRMSGTSMAAPHVCGAAAILAQQHPEWKAEQIKGALLGSAEPATKVPGSTDADEYAQGAGRLDVARAVSQPMTATPGNLSTHVRWPHSGPVTRTVTYTNLLDTPVTLEVPARGRPFQVAATRVTVPPKGTHDVHVVIDPRTVRPGDYADTLVARARPAGDTSWSTIRTVLGAYVEPEAHAATVRTIDRHGEPVEALLLAHSQDSDFHEWIATRDGTATVRLPADAYNLVGVVETGGTYEWTLVNVPVSLEDRDRTVVIDAREAVRPTMTVDDPSAEAERGFYAVQYRRGDADYTIGGSWNARTASVLPVRQKGLTYLHGRAFLKAGSGWNSPSPYVYNVADRRTNGIPSDPSYDVRKADLAQVTTTYRGTVTAGRGESTSGAVLGDVHLGGWPNAVDLPSRVAEFYTPDPGVRWWREFSSAGETVQTVRPRTYRRGRQQEVWNAAVAGPALPTSCTYSDDDLLAGPCGVREGDTISWFAYGNLVVEAGDHDRRGYAVLDGMATLSRGGSVLAEVALGEPLTVQVPTQPGRYTLEVTAARPRQPLSTRIETVHEFRSVPRRDRTALPLLAVRLAPRGLDDLNRAPAGTATTADVRVERYGPAPVTALTVELSRDDGDTWQEVDVRRSGHGWVAHLPAQEPGFVSLRAVARDAHGNAVTQTITRAYAVAIDSRVDRPGMSIGGAFVRPWTRGREAAWNEQETRNPA